MFPNGFDIHFLFVHLIFLCYSLATGRTMPSPPRASNPGSPKYSLSLSPRVLCQKDRCTLPAEIWATPSKVSFLSDLVITQACYSFSCVGATLLCLLAPILSPSVMGRCPCGWFIALKQVDRSFLSLPLT